MIGRLHFLNIMNICQIENEENEFVKIYFRVSTVSFSRVTYSRMDRMFHSLISYYHAAASAVETDLTTCCGMKKFVTKNWLVHAQNRRAALEYLTNGHHWSPVHVIMFKIL